MRKTRSESVSRHFLKGHSPMATFDARLAQFIVDRQPTADHSVEIHCQDHVGTYSPPFHCRWTGDGWINCRTDELVLATVLGWRERGPCHRDRGQASGRPAEA